MTGLVNASCIRVCNALISCGHTINQQTGWVDKEENAYIVRSNDLKKYLSERYLQPFEMNLETAKNFRGIILFVNKNLPVPVEHFDFWDGRTCAFKSYFNVCEKAFIWCIA
jgi:hypothetical protein